MAETKQVEQSHDIKSPMGKIFRAFALPIVYGSIP